MMSHDGNGKAKKKKSQNATEWMETIVQSVGSNCLIESRKEENGNDK